MAVDAARAVARGGAAHYRRSSSRLGVACVLVALAAYAQASLSTAAGWLSGGPRGCGGLRRCLALGPRQGAARLPPRALRRAGSLADLLSGKDDEDDVEPATQGAPGNAEGKDLAEFKVGESVDGVVRRKSKIGVWLDIGATRLALLKAPKVEAYKLEPNETLKGLTVEYVNLTENASKQQIDVSFAGLTQLVADRPELPPPGRKSKKVAKKKKEKENSGEQTILPVTSVSPRWVLDGGDIAGKEGSKVVVELRGGLSISSIDKKKQTISLVMGEGAAAEPKESAQKRKEQKPKKVRQKEDAFADLVEGQSIKGRVRNKNSLGVWVDVGKSEDAQVQPCKQAWLLDWGEELEFVVSKLDHERGTATLTLPNLEQHVAGREDKVIRLEDLQAPSVVTGHVASIKRSMGCFVEIGAEKQALVPTRLTKSAPLKLGQRVRLELESIDLEKKTMMIAAVHQDDDNVMAS